MSSKQPDDRKPFESEPISPEVLEWARSLYTEEEILAGIRELERTGGFRFEDFIGELEQKVRSRG